MSWTSYGTMSQRVSTATTGQVLPTRRRHASLTAANASGRRSSSDSPSSRRERNSTVFARSSSSERAWYSSAKRLISSTTGQRRLTSRSCFEPKTFVTMRPSMDPFDAAGPETSPGEAKARPDEWLSAGSGGAVSPCRSKLYDVSRLDAPFAFAFLELDGFPFMQRAETRTVDLRVMHEYFLSILARDEAVALGVVEPLDGASRH